MEYILSVSSFSQDMELIDMSLPVQAINTYIGGWNSINSVVVVLHYSIIDLLDRTL